MKCAIREPCVSIRLSTKLIEFIKRLDDPSIKLPANLLHVYQTITNDKQNRKIDGQSIPIVDYSDAEKVLLAKLSLQPEFQEQRESSVSDEEIETIPSESEVTGETASEAAQNDKQQTNSGKKDIEALFARLDGALSEPSDTETIKKEPKTNKTALNDKQKSGKKKRDQEEFPELTLNLNDLKWLNKYLGERRTDNDESVYLHELIGHSDVILPQNEYVERNPELEKRCQKLKREQEEQSYRAMTRNVDLRQQHIPSDTISYQRKRPYFLFMNIMWDIV